MAHSIEARVPFLDTTMIALAATIPAEWKLYRTPEGRQVEKWILRKACEDLLPQDIVWRDKEQFDEGSGTADLIGQRGLDDWLEPAATGQYANGRQEAALRSHEECVYHKILSDVYPAAPFVFENVARWASRPQEHLTSKEGSKP